jgi:hypothetical protein
MVCDRSIEHGKRSVYEEALAAVLEELKRPFLTETRPPIAI